MSVTRTWRLIAAFIAGSYRFTVSRRRPRPGNPRRRTCAAGSIRRILPDRRVIFRTRLPEAKTVAVRARGNDSGMGAETVRVEGDGRGTCGKSRSDPSVRVSTTTNWWSTVTR